MLSGTAAEFERDVPFGVWVDALDEHVAAAATARELGRRRCWPSSAGCCPPLRATGRAGDSHRGRRALPRPPGRCAALLELLAEDQPRGARARRPALGRPGVDRAGGRAAAARARRAGAAGASPSGPARRPSGWRPRWPPPPSRRVDAGPAERGRRAELLGDVDARSAGGHLPPRRRQPVLPRAAGPGQRAGQAVGRAAARRRRRGRRRRARVPAAVTAALAEELESLSLSAARAARTAPRWPGEPFEPDLAAAVAELSEDGGAGGAGRPDGPRPGARDPGTAPVHLPPPAGAAGGVRVHPRAAGAWPRTPARRRRWARAAPRPPSARTTWSSRPPRATRTRSRCCWRPAGRPRRARRARPARWFAAALRLLPAPTTASARSEVRMALASALRSAGELEALPRPPCWRRSSCCPPAPRERRIELIALCAAVEHWMGRHDDAHARLARAWEELPVGRHPGGRRRCRSSWPWTACTRWTSSRRWPWARRALDSGAGALGDGALIASAASALALGEAASGRGRGRARAPRHGAGADRPAVGRRAGAAAGGALLPGLGRELPRALRRRDRARRPRPGHRPRDRPGTAAGPDDAGQGLPVRDAGPAGRGARAVRGRGRVARACRTTRTTCSGRCSSWASPTTTSATWTR